MNLKIKSLLAPALLFTALSAASAQTLNLAIALTGVIRFFKSSSSTTSFEPAFLQTATGSAITVLGALWLLANR